MYITEVEQMSL